MLSQGYFPGKLTGNRNSIFAETTSGMLYHKLATQTSVLTEKFSWNKCVKYGKQGYPVNGVLLLKCQEKGSLKGERRTQERNSPSIGSTLMVLLSQKLIGLNPGTTY